MGFFLGVGGVGGCCLFVDFFVAVVCCGGGGVLFFFFFSSFFFFFFCHWSCFLFFWGWGRRGELVGKRLLGELR